MKLEFELVVIVKCGELCCSMYHKTIGQFSHNNKSTYLFLQSGIPFDIVYANSFAFYVKRRKMLFYSGKFSSTNCSFRDFISQIGLFRAASAKYRTLRMYQWQLVYRFSGPLTKNNNFLSSPVSWVGKTSDIEEEREMCFRSIFTT